MPSGVPLQGSLSAQRIQVRRPLVAGWGTPFKRAAKVETYQPHGETADPASQRSGVQRSILRAFGKPEWLRAPYLRVLSRLRLLSRLGMLLK